MPGLDKEFIAARGTAEISIPPNAHLIRRFWIPAFAGMTPWVGVACGRPYAPTKPFCLRCVYAAMIERRRSSLPLSPPLASGWWIFTSAL